MFIRQKITNEFMNGGNKMQKENIKSNISEKDLAKVLSFAKIAENEDLDADEATEKNYNKLKNYLLSLDFRIIEIIHTVFQIGRDSGFIPDEQINDYIVFYLEDCCIANKNKSIEIEQLCGKAQLAEFIYKGCERITSVLTLNNLG